MTNDYRDLSVRAQRIFYYIEKQLIKENTEYVHVTKDMMAWDLAMSIPNVKTGLRELKNKGFIVSKNHNSPKVKIGEDFEYKEV